MNDKEKLISFINKGKENKPVKEVHVIKDSPTEAHILLVNEDGTNVASNRFEIMDAHDLMTLIENNLYETGMKIDFNETNDKLIFKNYSMLKYMDPTTISFSKEIPTNLTELNGFINYLISVSEEYGMNIFISNFLVGEDEIELNTFISNDLNHLQFSGGNYISGQIPLCVKYDDESSTINNYSLTNNGTISMGEYNDVLSEYATYSSDGSKIIIRFNY